VSIWSNPSDSIRAVSFSVMLLGSPNVCFSCFSKNAGSKNVSLARVGELSSVRCEGNNQKGQGAPGSARQAPASTPVHPQCQYRCDLWEWATHMIMVLSVALICWNRLGMMPEPYNPGTSSNSI
jgi:hypothetical protein